MFYISLSKQFKTNNKMELTQHQLDRLDENFANYNCGIYGYERHEEIRKEILNPNN